MQATCMCCLLAAASFPAGQLPAAAQAMTAWAHSAAAEWTAGCSSNRCSCEKPDVVHDEPNMVHAAPGCQRQAPVALLWGAGFDNREAIVLRASQHPLQERHALNLGEAPARQGSLMPEQVRKRKL